MENNSSEFRVSKTYFCRETEEKNFSEQNENLMKDDDIRKEVELKIEPRAHPKSKTSLDEQDKEESRDLCEVEKFQSMDMKLGSKLRKRKKFESRAGKLIRIFDLGQKKMILLLTNIVWDMVKLNLQASVGYDLVLILKGAVLSFGERTSHFIEKSFPTFWFKIRT